MQIVAGAVDNMPDCTMIEVTLNQEDHSYMFDDEATPVKECSDLVYRATAGSTNKKLEVQCETQPAFKRRRTLQFPEQLAGTSLFSREKFSAISKFPVIEDSVDERLSDEFHLLEGFSEDTNPSSFNGLDLCDEEWYAEYLNDAETPVLPDHSSFDPQVDVSEYLNVSPQKEAIEIQPCVTRSSPKVVFKGRNPLRNQASKLPSSIIHPFALIKPCGVQGNMTLKDLNRKILTPPVIKANENKEKDAIVQTSAFSGKVVVGKTKICTKGGKGSITITRTKGL